MLAAVLGGSLLAQDRSIDRAVSRVPAADRAVRAFWLGIPAQGAPWRTLDRQARGSLRLISPRPAVGAMLYRETSIENRLVDLGAVDGLARFVRLRSGRLPHHCRPEHCEVLQLGGSGPLPSVAGLRLVRVGRATLASKVPFGDLITRETYRSVLSTALLYHTPASEAPFLVADGVDGGARFARVPVGRVSADDDVLHARVRQDAGDVFGTDGTVLHLRELRAQCDVFGKSRGSYGRWRGP